MQLPSLALLSLITFLFSGSGNATDVHARQLDDVLQPATIPLIIVGEGGTSGTLFQHAARTYYEEHGGMIFTAHNGDDFIEAVRTFIRENGRITHMEVFSHGNEVGLYLNQAPKINGALYVNDPALNESYIAASIYELSPGTFYPDATVRFNGCNVARGYPETDSFAEKFANHFSATVTAALGPTEFSRRPDAIDPYPDTSYLPTGFNKSVYMVPTAEAQGFITIDPELGGIGGYDDVFGGMEHASVIDYLNARGLRLDSNTEKFYPYRSITYGDAKEFCRIAIGKSASCSLPDEYEVDDGTRIRNLHALKMLADAYGYHQDSAKSDWHQPYVGWGVRENILTDDFLTRKWFTREEMSQLTRNFIARFDTRR